MREILIAWKDAAPAAAVLTALASAIVALLVLLYTRAANRRRATLDMVMKTLLDETAQRKQDAFKDLIKKHQDQADPFTLADLLPDAAKGTPNRRTMLYQFNVYELMALGIKRGIFDEAFYKRWYHNQFMTDYENAALFVTGLQQRKASIFCECTALYRKWAKQGHPATSPGRFRMTWWAITQQNDKIDRARERDKVR
jgi:Domain of unknown function (DUF4760)